jgi:addiction module RelE/StbE family toxin
MKVVFDARAAEDLTQIHSWIAADNLSAAAGVAEAILAGVERLAAYPLIGRVGKVEGTREWVVPRLPYIVVYQVDQVRDVLRVVAVFHGAQER